MKHWGRIFFIYADDKDKKNLRQVKGQPLENHVGNCFEILEKFKGSCFHESTKARLLEAVKLHDDGKKETFRIMEEREKQEKYEKKPEKKSGKKGKKEKQDTAQGFSYSFAGHRFRFPRKDRYIDALIRSHHEFSVEQVNREKAGFDNDDDRKHFADDLYLLCMADQLEAELAVKTIENKEGDIPRTFMEFVTQRLTDREFAVVPWPFALPEFTLTFKLEIPEIPDLSKKSAKEIQKIFELGTDFTNEEVHITLRRI